MSPRSSVLARRSLMVAWDVAAWGVALVTFSLLRYDLDLSRERWGQALAYVGCAVVLQLVWGFRSHLYLGRSKVGSYAEVTTLGSIVSGIAVLLAGLVLIGQAFAQAEGRFSIGILILLPPLAFLLMATGRWVFRARRERRRPGSEPNTANRVLVYGAGDIGHQVAALVDRADEPPYSIVGYVDDDPGKRFLRVGRYRVVGRGKDLEELARKAGAEGVILAISKAESTMIAAVNDRCRQAGLTLVVVPAVREMIGGQVQLDQLRQFNVVDLLGRRPIEADLAGIAEYLRGKVVLVTGAGGSIGSELAYQVHRLGPARLVLLDRDESGLHATQLKLYKSGLLERDDLVLCDIRDREALAQVFAGHQPQVVFHAAALKHLPMLERHPTEGWKTNVIGTLNVLQCASVTGVEHFVNISTDKAADPTSVLGQTKLLAERLTAWYAADGRGSFVSVRFGNVLGSRGSMLATFQSQIEQGGPVTVTHPEVTRFFMTIPEACELVLQAGAIGRSGDTLVLDMGEPVRIVDVAKRLIEESGKKIEIVYTGLRDGEKLHEILFSGTELRRPSAHPLICEVAVESLDPVSVLIDDAGFDRADVLRARPDSPVPEGPGDPLDQSPIPVRGEAPAPGQPAAPSSTSAR